MGANVGSMGAMFGLMGANVGSMGAIVGSMGEDLLPNALLACVVEVTVVGGGKIFGLL